MSIQNTNTNHGAIRGGTAESTVRKDGRQVAHCMLCRHLDTYSIPAVERASSPRRKSSGKLLLQTLGANFRCTWQITPDTYLHVTPRREASRSQRPGKEMRDVRGVDVMRADVVGRVVALGDCTRTRSARRYLLQNLRTRSMEYIAVSPSYI